MALSPAEGATRARSFYMAAWRWHFYAGLYVAPFLVMLATTGLIMLYISAFVGLNGERMTVPIGSATLPVTELAASAAAAVPQGRVSKYVSPLSPGHVALFRVDAGAASQAVQVDPYTAQVMGQSGWDSGLYPFVNKVHGTLLLGDLGDRLIEIAAGFGIVLIVTGLFLWWPRDRQGVAAALLPDLRARGRSFWKSLHRSLGAWVAALLLVFLVSGLSWTGIWGTKLVQAWSTFPAAKWDNVPLSGKTHADMNHGVVKQVPWGLEQTPLPASGSDAGTVAVARPVTLNSVAAFAQGMGLVGRFQINLPATADGVWTISHDSMSNDGPDPSADRTIHIDRYTGNVLADVGYGDYSVYARAMAYGIALHEGDMGLWNLVLNAVYCLAVILLSVSGIVMWWIRRPSGAGRLAAPPLPVDLPLWKGAVFAGLLVSLAFPLVGLTLLAVLAFDLLVLANLPRLRRALS